MATIVQEPIAGQVILGTLSGGTLAQYPYHVPAGTHAGPPLAAALEKLYLALPELLLQNGPSRFTFLVRQGNGASDPMVDVYHASGLPPGTLFSTVASKLLKARAAARHATARPVMHVQGVEVSEVPNEGIDWTPPDHVGRVLRTLADPWAGSRA